MSARPPFTRVTFFDEAIEDLKEIQRRSPAAIEPIFRLLKGLDSGAVEPKRLHDFAKTGDLSDCGKLVVEVDGEPEHRIVVRSTSSGLEVIEIIAVEARAEDIAYLLAGLRLGRITGAYEVADAKRKVALVRKRLRQPPPTPAEGAKKSAKASKKDTRRHG